jgi:hypothetical protein
LTTAFLEFLKVYTPISKVLRNYKYDYTDAHWNGGYGGPPYGFAFVGLGMGACTGTTCLDNAMYADGPWQGWSMLSPTGNYGGIEVLINLNMSDTVGSISVG